VKLSRGRTVAPDGTCAGSVEFTGLDRKNMRQTPNPIPHNNTKPITKVLVRGFFRRCAASAAGRIWFAPSSAMTIRKNAIHAPNANFQSRNMLSAGLHNPLIVWELRIS